MDKDKDCRLELGVPATPWEVLAFKERAVDKEIFGLRSLRPFDGDKAENRWCEDEDSFPTVASVEAEATDGLRKPVKEMDSLLLLRGKMLPVAEALADICRGTRGAVVDVIAGDVLAWELLLTVFGDA